MYANHTFVTSNFVLAAMLSMSHLYPMDGVQFVQESITNVGDDKKNAPDNWLAPLLPYAFQAYPCQPPGRNTCHIIGYVMRYQPTITPEVVNTIIETYQNLTQDQQSKQAVAYAVVTGNTQGLEEMLATKSSEDHEPELFVAAMYGHASVMKILLEAYKDRQELAQNACLLMAARCGKTECVELLLSFCNVNHKNSKGRTPLIQAARKGHHETVDALAKKKANLNEVDTYNKTALMYACTEGHVLVVQKLLAHGADTTKKDQSGFTALDHAKSHRYIEIVELLRGTST